MLVRLVACGVCHTDLYTASGADPSGYAPTVLGHEGAGVVERIGEGVTSVAPGDHVVTLFSPQCRECVHCLDTRTNLCLAIREQQNKGFLPGRHDAARSRRRADPALHGHFDVRRVHGHAGDRARQDLAGGAARPRVRLRLRPLHRARRCNEHCQGAGGLDLRRLRRRPRRARRRRRLPAAGRRAHRRGRSLARAARARARAGRDRGARRRPGHGAAGSRPDGRVRRRLHLRGDRQRRRHATGGRVRPHGLGARHRLRGRGQGRDARHRAALPDHGPPRRRIVVRRRQGARRGAAARGPLARTARSTWIR